MKKDDFSNRNEFRKNNRNNTKDRKKSKKPFLNDYLEFEDVKIKGGGKKSRNRDRIKRMRDYNE